MLHILKHNRLTDLFAHSILHHLHKTAAVALLLAAASTTCSCTGKAEATPDEEARRVLTEALCALYQGNAEDYLVHIDMGEPMDSFQLDFMRMALTQHSQWCEQTKGVVIGINTVDAKMISDTVCYVRYELTFADSTREVSSQKLIRKEGTWRIRVRN